MKIKFSSILKIKVAILLSVFAVDSFGEDFFVTPEGSSSPMGTEERPFNFNQALNAVDIIGPGDTVWLKEGVYSNPQDGRRYRIWLKGNEDQPVVIRNYNNERARIIGQPGESGIEMDRPYVWLWGLEISSSNTDRVSNESSPFPHDIPTGEGIQLTGHSDIPGGLGCRIINCAVYNNTGLGIGLFGGSHQIEIYGTLFFYNGWLASDRTHGHGIYKQNTTWDKKVEQNICFKNFSHGIQAFTDNGNINNLFFRNNVMFENKHRNMIMGGGTISENSQLLENYFYSTSGSQNVNIGGNKGTRDSFILNNFLVGGSVFFDHDQFDLTMFGNQFYAPNGIDGISTSSYPDNIFSNSIPDSNNKIFVLPNKYESGRATLVIYNFKDSSSVQVDLSDVGLNTGDIFGVKDVENFFGGDVVEGEYQGNLVDIPMNQTESTPIIGDFPDLERHTDSKFGVFIVYRKQESEVEDTSLIPPTNIQISSIH